MTASFSIYAAYNRGAFRPDNYRSVELRRVAQRACNGPGAVRGARARTHTHSHAQALRLHALALCCFP